MVLGKLPVSGRPTIWISVGQGPTALAVGAGRCCLDIFTLYFLSPEHQSKLLYFCRTCFSKVRYRRPVFHPSFRPQLWVVGWCDGAG